MENKRLITTAQTEFFLKNNLTPIPDTLAEASDAIDAYIRKEKNKPITPKQREFLLRKNLLHLVNPKTKYQASNVIQRFKENKNK